jgi:UDPglucose 6-dehydrogenase
MSHLGLCYSVAAAAKGFKVICFDYDSQKISKLKKYNIEIEEQNLNKLIQKNKQKIIYTDDLSSLSDCSFVYYSSDVNTDNKGNSDKKELKNNLEKLILNLEINIPLIILSQVPPGFTRKYLKIKNNIYYQVETLIFGEAIFRALNPERFIVGVKNSDDSLPISINQFLEAFNCPILIMNYESAELAKIAINCYLASSVSTTNTLAEISNKIGANWDDIVPTLRLDRRIGKYAYLSPGLGLAGGNIERDLNTIEVIGNKISSNTEFISSIIDLSEYSKKWLYRTIKPYINNDNNICILGLSYKENTNSIKNSASLELIKKIKNYSINVYDPLVKKIDVGRIKFKTSINTAIKGSDILVIATPWDEFKSLDLRKIKSLMKGNIILDPYRVFDEELSLRLGFIYYSIG